MNEILDPEQELKSPVEDKNKVKPQPHQQAQPLNRLNTFSNNRGVTNNNIAKEVDPLIDFKRTSIPTLDTIENHKEEDIHNLNKSSLGPGIILKNTREEARLSQDDVAKELRLAVRHIEYLEQDQYEKFTAIAFYVGYIRNYSKLLYLDPEKMIAKFHAVYKVMPENSSFKRIKASSWQDLWPMKLFVSNNRVELEKVKNIKLLIFGSIITVVFLLTWWLVSSSGASIDENSLVDNQDLQKLSPEKVDQLLPSSPVIANNNVQTESGNNSVKKVSGNNRYNKYSKQNKLDNFS